MKKINEINEEATINSSTRRKIVKGAAWSAPIVVATSLPKHAQASADGGTTTTTTMREAMLDVGEPALNLCIGVGGDGLVNSFTVPVTNMGAVPIMLTAVTLAPDPVDPATVMPALPATVAPGEVVEVSADFVCPSTPESLVITTDLLGDVVVI